MQYLHRKQLQLIGNGTDVKMSSRFVKLIALSTGAENTNLEHFVAVAYAVDGSVDKNSSMFTLECGFGLVFLVLRMPYFGELKIYIYS